jgi:hypothetical protein
VGGVQISSRSSWTTSSANQRRNRTRDHEVCKRTTIGPLRSQGPGGRLAMTIQPTIDENKLNEFVGRFVGDLGAVMHAATVLIGDKLGLYKAMSDGDSITCWELAERTGTDERYMQEWLSAQAASGYAEYDPATDRFHSPRAGIRPDQRVQPAVRPRRAPGSRLDDQGRGYGCRGDALRSSRGLARASPRPLRGRRAVLPAQLHRQPG